MTWVFISLRQYGHGHEVEPDNDRVIGSCCFPGNTKSHRVTVQRGHVSILVPRANKLQDRSVFPRQTSFTVAFTIQLGWLYCREHLKWFSSTIVMFQCFLIVSLSVSCSPLSVSDSSAIKHSSDVDGVGWSGINCKLAVHVTRQGHKQNSNYNNGELLLVSLHFSLVMRGHRPFFTLIKKNNNCIYHGCLSSDLFIYMFSTLIQEVVSPQYSL